MTSSQKTVIVGAGPVGSLAAIYAARRGHQVEVYELRPAWQFQSADLMLCVSPGILLLQSVMDGTIPMRGRMIHGKTSKGSFYEQAQDYDARGQVIYTADRSGLNARLLDALELMPGVKLFFNHKLTDADFQKCRAWFEVQNSKSQGRSQEVEVEFDLMIGADGAHSAVRYHMMKFTRMNYQQEYIDTLWCEFHLKPCESAISGRSGWEQFKVSPRHLHIWPGKDFMFIAIPNKGGSFTCTLFLPSREFSLLEGNPDRIPGFFDKNFPGMTGLISHEELISSFTKNPHLPLISIKCSPYHFGSSGVIIGDAAHAMVHFYGQGMNAGMEDVRILFSAFDKSADGRNDDRLDGSKLGCLSPLQRGQALTAYSQMREPDAHAINYLAPQNYIEMRSSVLSRRYRLRKYLEEVMSKYFPTFGWKTKYSRVSFSNESYAEVVKRSERQGRILMRAIVGLVASPLVISSLIFAYRSRDYFRHFTKGIPST